MLKARLWVLVVSTVLGLIIAEIGLRLVGPVERAGKSPDHILWQPDAEIGFAPAANLKTIVYWSEWVNEIRTNEFGFRISNFSPGLADVKSETILFLGDSQTMAAQVPAEATYVSLIEK